MASKHTVNVTSDTFSQEVLDAATPVVIDFWAPWCGPCRAIAPVLDQLAQSYAGRVKVAKVNVDEHPQLASAFRVRGIPTLVALNAGEIVGEIVGFGGKARLEELFDHLTALGEDTRAAS